MKATMAGIFIFLFLLTSFLCLYQIGATSGVLRGGYLIMSAYYTSAFGDRPGSFLLADRSLRGDYVATLLVQDPRSMRFFRSKVGSGNIQAYGQNAWIVQGVSQLDLFGYLQSMELGILATGAVMALCLVVPYFYDAGWAPRRG